VVNQEQLSPQQEMVEELIAIEGETANLRAQWGRGEEGVKKEDPLCHFDGEAVKMAQVYSCLRRY
jgi:hypothetical protein